MNKRRIGTEEEKLASEYLRNQGMRIVETNFRSRQGEIDLVGHHEGYLVFIEVKYRSSDQKGHALDAVDGRKQRQICRVADSYRYLHRLGDNVSVRYDVVGIQGAEVIWIKNAFPHIYTRR